jgi:hypothetical protein
MAHLRKPTDEVLELTGAFLKDPTRRRLPGPKSGLPVGGPPEHLAPHEAAAWLEFVANAPAGVLTGGDRWVLEWRAGSWRRAAVRACSRPRRATCGLA